MRFFSLLAICLLALPLAAADGPFRLIATCDKPILFSYAAWEGKTQTAGNNLRVQNLSSKGGGGWNVTMNFAADAAMIPALRIRTLAGNTAAKAVLLLLDGTGNSGRWTYVLPQPSESMTTLRPESGKPLSTPDATDKGLPQLANITQWQVIGDWSDTTANFEVEGLAVVAAP